MHDIIDEEDRHFQVFELLMKISSLVLDPVVSCKTISLLQRLITQFLEDFKIVFKQQITPKMHYLIHCPRLTLLCGPIVRLWDMRFEAKHKDFKNIARNASFKNLTKSLAKGEQSSMMAKLANSKNHVLFCNSLVKGPSTPLNADTLTYAKEVSPYL